MQTDSSLWTEFLKVIDQLFKYWVLERRNTIDVELVNTKKQVLWLMIFECLRFDFSAIVKLEVRMNLTHNAIRRTLGAC